MRHVIYNTLYQNSPVEVKIGWDAGVNGYYLLVARLADSPDLDNIVYSHLFESDPYSLSLDYFLFVLAGLDIQLPHELIATLERYQNAMLTA